MDSHSRAAERGEEFFHLAARTNLPVVWLFCRSPPPPRPFAYSSWRAPVPRAGSGGLGFVARSGGEGNETSDSLMMEARDGGKRTGRRG